MSFSDLSLQISSQAMSQVTVMFGHAAEIPEHLDPAVTDAPLNMYPQIKCNAFWIEKIHVSPDLYVMLPLCRSLVKTRYGFYLPHNVQCLLFSRNGNQLINLGTMSSKLAVHATSDVFRQTKETMKTAQEEWTKVRWVGVYKHALDLHGHI